MGLYSYKRFGNKYIVSVRNRMEIVETLYTFCKEKEIKAGKISGIGAVSEATLRFFNPETKKYEDHTFREQMEIASVTGNISQLDGSIYVHIHVTLGRSDFTALAGHLHSARLNGAGEFVIEKYDGALDRYYDNNIGLNMYDL
ncbi:MAG: DUF296 domain-containing protein [Coprobacter sp.]|nr:DNA-binding protein [Barnesiella sp. GGCC_0306]MBS7039532.1 DNA-binding protein [Bacteroidales bacterium]PWM88413.1 MAG: DUF296 domain-containing protein [Coprobacter sp.]